MSYSDQRQRHTGLGVYGACGWTYLGETAREATLWIHGREVHARTVSSKYGTRDLRWLQANVDSEARRIDCPPKHRWALALTPTMRERLALLAKPYPKALDATEAQVSGARRPPVVGVHSSPNRAGTTGEGTLRKDPVAPPLVHEAAHV
jgi:hypothetical protein